MSDRLAEDSEQRVDPRIKFVAGVAWFTTRRSRSSDTPSSDR
jgi:hypothetical protein